jgi:hypothetical protein
VRLVRGNPQDSTDQGRQVSACTLEHDGRRSRTIARRALTGSSKLGPSALRSTCAAHPSRKREAPAAKHIGRTRNPTRVCLGATTERQRSARIGEGSTRSEKDRGGSASSTLKRRWQEVRRDVTARSWRQRIASPTLPFPDHANGWGCWRGHPRFEHVDGAGGERTPDATSNGAAI